MWLKAPFCSESQFALVLMVLLKTRDMFQSCSYQVHLLNKSLIESTWTWASLDQNQVWAVCREVNNDPQSGSDFWTQTFILLSAELRVFFLDLKVISPVQQEGGAQTVPYVTGSRFRDGRSRRSRHLTDRRRQLVDHTGSITVS